MRQTPGRVVASHGHTVVVEGPDGATHPCSVRRQAGRPVTGDVVLWASEPGGRGVVVAVEPRRNLLARPDGRGASRAIAANLDQVVVVFAVEPDCPDTLLDRYLVAATHYGLDALLLLNKTDRAGPAERSRLNERLARYGGLGYATCESSARAPDGVDALAAHLRGRTSVLVGPSGVGKSSLVRALIPAAEARTGEVSAATGHGRHTTSASTLFHLPGGGELIDSPGVRDFGVWHLPREAIARGFVEIQALAAHCRFRDCRHRGEPGCAVGAAVTEGRVSPARLASFLALTGAE